MNTMCEKLIIGAINFLLLSIMPAIAQFQFGDVYYTNDAFSVTITGRAGTNLDITIPDSINGLPVGTIGSNAFYDILPELHSITIPQSVTNIQYLAFAANFGLTNLILPTNLITIGPNAFDSSALVSRPLKNRGFFHFLVLA